MVARTTASELREDEFVTDVDWHKERAEYEERLRQMNGEFSPDEMTLQRDDEQIS